MTTSLGRSRSEARAGHARRPLHRSYTTTWSGFHYHCCHTFRLTSEVQGCYYYYLVAWSMPLARVVIGGCRPIERCLQGGAIAACGVQQMDQFPVGPLLQRDNITVWCDLSPCTASIPGRSLHICRPLQKYRSLLDVAAVAGN